MKTLGLFKYFLNYANISVDEITGLSDMSCKDLFRVDATLVANEFLDKYMPTANGEYVKVYLYLLRNRSEELDIETIADKLELTDNDVRRALKYWEKIGILTVRSEGDAEDTQNKPNCLDKTASSPVDSTAKTDRVFAVKEGHADAGSSAAKSEGGSSIDRLAQDAEFKQLLFMVQKYRSKILTEREEQILAYLYDGLHLPFDVLDYLVQYCVETDHSDMRYIEKTGIDWAERGIKTVKEAQCRTREFDKIRESSKTRAAVRRSKNGITRDNDLDSWLNNVMQRNIQ